ncbi:MAG: hypothetical protein M0R03_16905 [Novosphingobium sp.]|nr:hypothetical protein [Novosphingobium sp.]
MHQTLSARVFVEAQIHGKPAWQRRMKLIDRAWRVLSLGAGSRGHCEDAWASEVSRAERTLELAGGTE